MKCWIARDKDKRLFLYYAEPISENGKFKEPITLESFEINSELFHEVTYENSPQQVKIELV